MTDREIIEELAIVEWIDPSLPTKDIVNRIAVHCRQESWDPAISEIAANVRKALLALSSVSKFPLWKEILTEFDKQKGYTDIDGTSNTQKG